jgi:glucan-binding YG repeat protein
VGIAVRAIASDAMAAQDAVIGTDGIARWDNLKAYTDGYKVQISYVDNANKKAKTSTKTTNNYLDVTGYINSAKPGTLKVEVKTMPDYNDSRFYNIANGDWKQTGYPVDTTDYEEDRWDFLSDYKAVNDGNFAQNLNSAGSANYYRGALATSADGSWNRVTYKWQFLVNGVPYNQGWKKINGYWYYFDPDGFMHTGWLNANGKWYYLESQVGAACGIMYTGVHQINGQNYQFDANGVCLNR